MIDLEPPVTGGYDPAGAYVPLQQAPMFGRNRMMSRWHIPRSGVLKLTDSTRSFTAWCSATLLFPDGVDDERRALMIDTPTDDVPVCGSCVGRASGAGRRLPVVEVTHPGGVVFEPRTAKVPKACPGAKYTAWEHVNHRVGRCYVCREYMPTRAKGGPYDGYVALVAHDPGPGLADPCPFHLWNRIGPDGRCTCGADPFPLADRT